MITHIFCDLDGTITFPSRGHDPRIHDLLQRVMNKGITVGVVTGRDAGFAMAFHQILKLNGPIICENGAVLYNNYPGNWSPVILGSIPANIKEKIFQSCAEYIHNPLKQHSITFYMKNNRQSLSAAEKKIKANVKNFPVVVMQSSSAINVNPNGIDKGAAIQKYAEIVGKPLDNFAFVGDAPNDFPAFDMITRNGGCMAFVGSDKNIVKQFKTACLYVSKAKNSAGTVEFLDYFLRHCSKHVCTI